MVAIKEPTQFQCVKSLYFPLTKGKGGWRGMSKGELEKRAEEGGRERGKGIHSRGVSDL
jgi:hypothetical protein